MSRHYMKGFRSLVYRDWSEGRARLGVFRAPMARIITQLSPSLTPTLGSSCPISFPLKFKVLFCPDLVLISVKELVRKWLSEKCLIHIAMELGLKSQAQDEKNLLGQTDMSAWIATPRQSNRSDSVNEIDKGQCSPAANGFQQLDYQRKPRKAAN